MKFFYLVCFFHELIGYTIFICCQFYNLIVSADRILINSDTISNIINNIFITLYREVLFDITNILVVRW